MDRNSSALTSESATRQSWPNIQPLPQQRAPLSLERTFTEEEYELIRQGVIPEAMEDKWFILLEEDVLYFHRSWTGFCIYQVSFKKNGAQFSVVEALVNRDSNQYSATDNHYDVNLLNFLIDNFLLPGSSTFPVPDGVPPGIATGLLHHHVAGVGPRARQKQEPISPGTLVVVLAQVAGPRLKWIYIFTRRDNCPSSKAIRSH